MKKLGLSLISISVSYLIHYWNWNFVSMIFTTFAIYLGLAEFVDWFPIWLKKKIG